MRRLALALALAVGCDDPTLVALPDPPDAGADVGARKPRSPEVCDGRDNDQNGTVDDVPLEFFWPDGYPPPVGECRPAVSACVDGELRFTGLVLPAAEVPGDGRDNDCDGVTDECDASDVRLHAVVMDGSGSFNLWDVPARAALCDLDATRHDFALAMFGGTPPNRTVITAAWGDDLCGGYVDLSGSYEHAYAALVTLLEAQPWPAGDRYVTIVTDEEPQHEGASDGVVELVEMCLAEKFAVSVVTRPLYEPFWRVVADACGGYVADLDDPALAANIIGEPLCSP